MLNYIVAINKNKKAIIIDFETDKKNCNPDIGYETDFEDWQTDVKEYIEDNDIYFDSNKAFQKPGIYKVIGYDNTENTPDGDYYNYIVEKIIKLQDLTY